jgi:8-hydroxy-5-deazaflavin:NADPH oxidoreductase
MKVGILGSGQVAQTLGAGFLAHGHEVTLGTRDPSKLEGWAAQHPGGRVGSFSEAAAFGELLVLAVKGSVATDVLRTAGSANLAGKPVLDTTNPLGDSPPVNGVLSYFTDLDESLMERLQRDVPDARFVKAFNSVGSAKMVDPSFPRGRPTMFICGNDEAAKRTASEVLESFGWDVADMGAAEAARAIEPLCILWCIPGLLHNEWTHAFALLRSGSPTGAT